MESVSEPDGGWKRHNGICFACPPRHGRMRVALNSFLLGGRIAAPETLLIWGSRSVAFPERLVLWEEKWSWFLWRGSV